jgi:hypothetical protein
MTINPKFLTLFGLVVGVGKLLYQLIVTIVLDCGIKG